MLEVLRSQYPVGQGCFHAGHVKLDNESAQKTSIFNYIYDCGAMNQGDLKGAIDCYRTKYDHVDALFLSHLHEDHVNGIDLLLSSVNVDTVYMPYLDNLLPILDVIEADLQGTVPTSYIEAKIDPQLWFSRRGVSRLVRVLSVPEEDTPSGGDDVAPVEPKGPAGFDVKIKTQKSTGRFYHPELKKMESGEVLKICEIVPSCHWTLVPHVDPAPKQKVKEFNRKIRKACGLPDGARLTSRQLGNVLRDRSRCKALRKCYDEITKYGGGNNHNRISMSLYSGPEGYCNTSQVEYALLLRIFDKSTYMSEVEHTYHLREEDRAVGWIGTGDAMLKDSKVRKAWENTYRLYRDHISTMLLPHHGSQGNFHSDLLTSRGLRLCVASASNSSQFKHPSCDVIKEVCKKGISFHHVSQDPQTRIDEVVRILDNSQKKI